MKRFIFCAVALAACQPSTTETDLPLKADAAAQQVEDGVVALVLNPPVSEPRACIIPITIANGLEAPTSVTMIAFDLTGPGEDAKGNMFAPQAAPGDTSEARVIVEGQSCDAFDTLTIPEIRCTSGEENCTDDVEFVDGDALRFSQSG
jgi:hypothetical protein